MLQAAAEVSDGFPDGVVWIPLAPLRGESALVATVAQALEVHERPDLSLEDSIVTAFAAKRTLIVADNCEHPRRARPNSCGGSLKAAPR